MKQSALTQKQLAVLQTLLLKHGLVVTSEQVAAELAHTNVQSTRRFISTLVGAGWLVRIKQGLYQIADVSSLGTLTLSRFTLAQLLVPVSYVSFRAALQHHSLHDQGLRSVTSVALTRHAPVLLEGTTYTYVSTRERSFFGFEEVLLDGMRVRIATSEKALLDLLQFQRTQTSVDLVLELLREQSHHLDLNRLTRFAQQLPMAVQQTTGFLLEAAGLSVTDALVASARKSAVSRLTPESNTYNSRWRLYVDPYFVDTKAYA